VSDLDLGPASESNGDWLDRLKREQEYLDEALKRQPEGAEAAGPPGFEPKPLPDKAVCRKYYRDIDLGDIEAKLELPVFGEVASVELGDDLGLGGKRNPLDIPGFRLTEKAMGRVNDAAQVTEIGEDLGGYWQWECIDFSKPEYYDQIGDDWHVVTGVELVRDTVGLSSEDWRDGVPEDTLVRTPDGCVIPVSLLNESANLGGSELWMEFADLVKLRQELEAKVAGLAEWRQGLLEEKRDIGLDGYTAEELREVNAELRTSKRRLEHLKRWTGEQGPALDRPTPLRMGPRLRVPSQQAMRDLSCEMMTLDCVIKYYGAPGWSVDRPPTEEQARKHWERHPGLPKDVDEDVAKRLMECVKKKWPDWLRPPTAEELRAQEEELRQKEEERRRQQPIYQRPVPVEDVSVPAASPELMPTVPGMDMAQTVKFSRRADDRRGRTTLPSISWPTTVIVGIVVGIIIGVGSVVWWPVQRQGDSPADSSPVVCNYDGQCQYGSGERRATCADCRPTPTATRRAPTPTTGSAAPPPPTDTPVPTATSASAPVPPPAATPTLEPTATSTLAPAPAPQCDPGEWSECGGLPPAVVCDAEYVSQCQADGTWGPCQWDPGKCGAPGPEPPPEEGCVCGNGICESDTPCYESSFNCAADCGPPTCERWLDAVDCEAAGGRWVCDIAECYCHCSS